ncbi:MAG: radical SAM protein [Pelagibacteraceae bacterium]|nr:radical SAM protein [Pelagibacteraceae bacterium]OUV89321.1 MAG: radical SAM protein [Pelagibacteraceae bacterium TMED146]RZO93181.1 MAG: radical SAM protein [alpha proteobacterium HIMB114]|tara:strand:+ start:13282 stop:14190 length:909 start_codon:yes stop_codon:yes gene_type:complete
MLKKFENKIFTADNKARAFIESKKLKTLWFNTGTLCNLTCKNCYIESSPKNDRLSYLSYDEFKMFVNESIQNEMGTEEIGFTGGEPFMNKDIFKMIKYSLDNGFKTLVLTNAMKPMMNNKNELNKLNHLNLTIRVSIDHYNKDKHEQIRGPNSWDPMIEGLKWLSKNKFNYCLATRLMWNEDEETTRRNFKKFINQYQLTLDVENKNQLVTFAEMDEKKDTPEITTECWGILNKSPDTVMCSTSRMIVKKKGNKNPSVIACTLLPYNQEFDLGDSLKESMKKIYLNHPHCSKFCVLGGSSCS